MHQPIDNNAATAALKSAGLQVTAQRIAVYQAIEQHPHAMAEALSDVVRSQIGTISRQAVYDALNAMTEQRLIRRIQPAGSAARYEHRLDNHHHLVCRVCGVMEDVDCAQGTAPCLQTKDDHGFIIDEAEITYWGHCPRCQN